MAFLTRSLKFQICHCKIVQEIINKNENQLHREKMSLFEADVVFYFLMRCLGK